MTGAMAMLSGHFLYRRGGGGRGVGGGSGGNDQWSFSIPEGGEGGEVTLYILVWLWRGRDQP